MDSSHLESIGPEVGVAKGIREKNGSLHVDSDVSDVERRPNATDIQLRRRKKGVAKAIREKNGSLHVDSDVSDVERRPNATDIQLRRYKKGVAKAIREKNGSLHVDSDVSDVERRPNATDIQLRRRKKGTPLLHKEMKRMKNSQELLGRGAFGEVYKRHDDKSNTTMAVKIIKHCGTMSEKEVSQSLKNEIEILGKLDHHRLIKFHGCLQKETCVEIFLEYMPNGSVKDYMSNHHEPFSEPMTAKITMDVLEGIIYLHGRKILHRDVKGSNVLLDCEMNAKLGDFGISKEIQTLTNSNTCCNTHVGSPYWMSPERIKGEKYGKQADIWSIGCTVVEMLTMHPPWHEFETHAAVFKIGLGTDPIYHLPPATSTMLKDFLSQTFRQKPEERPKATELLNHSFIRSLDLISLR